MKFINRFIDWRKNIQRLEYFGIGATFSNQITSFEKLKDDAYSTFGLVPDMSLRNKLLHDNIQYEKTGENQRYLAEFDYTMMSMPNIMPQFSLGYNIISSLNIINYTLGFRLSKINHDLLVQIAKIKGLSFMVLSNPIYKSWDNNDRPESYKYRKDIKTYFDKAFQMERVDITKRPGRYTCFGNITWHGGHEFWFGPGFYEYVSKEHILEFEHADNVQELENDVVYIKLMDMHDYWTYEGQGRLWDLRMHLDIDRLEEDYKISLENS